MVTETEGKIKVSDLTPHPKNTYYFDDMDGDAWDALIQSISTSGVTNAVTITDKKVIISGHQRVRACKVLGIDEVSYKMIRYDSENDEIKDLIESNLRQRVLGNPNPVKMGRCFEFLQNYYGIEHGGDRKSSQKLLGLISQDDLADEYGITSQTIRNYVKLAKSNPALADFVENGVVSKSAALNMIKYLSDDEQEQLISQLDATKKYTQKQIQQYIDENRRLKNERQDVDSLKQKIAENEREQRKLRNRIAELSRQQVKTEIVTKEVDKPETLALIKDLRLQLAEKERKNKEYSDKLVESSRKLSQAMGSSTNYQLVSHCSKITKQMLDFVQSMSKYDYMAESFNEIPDATRIEYEKCIRSVKRWADRILDTINKKVQIIEIQEEI